MHETGIVRDLVRRVVGAARESGADRVVGVTVWLGALSQFSPEHFREHFDDEARDTLAAKARLSIEASTDFTHPTLEPVPYVGLQYIAIPEFADAGTQMTQWLADYVVDKMTLDEAISNTQDLFNQVAIDGNYRK